MNSRNQETAGGKMSRMGRWLVLAVAASLAPLASAADSVLKQTSFAALPGQKTEIRFSFDVPPPAPKIYMIESPPRLVMDFFGVTNEQAQRMLSVESGVVSTLNFAEAQGRLRVVANLTEAASYSTSADGNNLYVQLGDARMGSGKAAQAAPADRALAASNSASVMSDQTRVQSIDFERIDGGTGRVVINMSDDEAGLDIIEEGNNIVVNLLGASLAKELENRTDVQAFATPVMYVDAMAAGGNTAILIKPSAEPYDYMAYQTGNQLVLDFKPMTDQELANRKADLFPYSGEEIDLNFQNVELRSVLQIIAEVAEKNLVVGDEVGGNVTLRLKNVPWDQALDIILQTNGLDKRIVGNVMLIGGASQIADRERQELEAQEQVQNLAPLLTEYVQINFRRASEMKTYLEQANLVSERGFLLADDQTNILMVRETGTSIEEIRRTLNRFDVEVAQIMVEARIVTASSSFAQNLGIKWGLSGSADNGNVVLGQSASGPGTAGIGTDGLNVDFGVAGPTIAIGFLRNNLLLAAELSALESSGTGEVISQPKVITTNGKAANITSGQQIPYQTVEDGSTSTEFKDVALSLNVTPQLNPGDRIAMDLAINQDSIGRTLANGEISINTNQLNTSVVVNDGDTIVLGGVFRTEASEGVEKVPLLGDLPIVGAAFRNKQTSEQKNELLIFITPKLIREALTSR
ncbi:MAG TPA: type IV pilus secretin PilQ [Marinobacterium sp.]|nr:type IV pilus secretin PilQ [Marinobacterium sp.]